MKSSAKKKERVKPKRVSVVGLPYQEPRHAASQYRPEFADTAKLLCQQGATDEDLADALEVSLITIKRWQSRYREFNDACTRGKNAADERVVRSLYARATGYTFDSEKIVVIEGEVVRLRTREHVPPDTTACIFWLKNRRSREWRDKTESDLTLNLRVMGDKVPLGEAQSSFRQIRGATAEMLERELKTIEGQAVEVSVEENEE